MRGVDSIEDELRHGKTFALPLMELKIKGFENDYLDMLDTAMEVWSRGEDYEEYAQYIWGIVYSYFDNLKEYKNYQPLLLLEQKISSLNDKEGANWLALKMVYLRRAYLYKPGKISEAIQKYNEAKKFSDKYISNSSDLF